MEPVALPEEARREVGWAAALTVIAMFFQAISGTLFLLIGLGMGNLLLIVLGIVPFLLLGLTYTSVFEPLQHEDIQEARTPGLLLALLSLVLGGVVAGLLLIWAYLKTSFARRVAMLGPSRGRPS